MYKADRIAFNKYFDTDYGDNLACRHCGLIKITPQSTLHQEMMVEFREWFGRSMPIISGTRCEYWNEHEGGAEDSRHLYGDADDVAFIAEFYKFSKMRKRGFLINIKFKWQALCDRYGVRGGVGFYNNWFHLDSRPIETTNEKPCAFWDYSTYF